MAEGKVSKSTDMTVEELAKLLNCSLEKARFIQDLESGTVEHIEEDGTINN